MRRRALTNGMRTHLYLYYIASIVSWWSLANFAWWVWPLLAIRNRAVANKVISNIWSLELHQKITFTAPVIDCYWPRRAQALKQKIAQIKIQCKHIRPVILFNRAMLLLWPSVHGDFVTQMEPTCSIPYSEDNEHRRSLRPKAYKTDTRKCPVSCFKEFLSRKTTAAKSPENPFFQAVHHRKKTEVIDSSDEED